MPYYKGLCPSKLFKYTVYFISMLNIFNFELDTMLLMAGCAAVV